MVRANGAISKKQLSSTGSPQGCALSPLLYILYTNDCRSNYYYYKHLLKFTDDTVLISQLQDGKVHHEPVVDDFVEWCNNHFLKLSINKTKDMAINFWKTSHSTFPSIIRAHLLRMWIVTSLGTIIDKNLNLDLNTSTIRKTGLRLYFLQRLNTFNADKASTLAAALLVRYLEQTNCDEGKASFSQL